MTDRLVEPLLLERRSGLRLDEAITMVAHELPFASLAGLQIAVGVRWYRGRERAQARGAAARAKVEPPTS